MQRFSLLLILVSAFVLTSCGWDDDRAYAIESRASFLIAESNASGLPTVWRYQAGVLQAGWNGDMGVADADFGGLAFKEGSLWLADVGASSILQIDPSSEDVVERIDGLPIRPHYFAIGERHILVGDTSSQQIAFIRRKNGEEVVIDLDAAPGRVIYNNRLFFLQKGDSSLAIYDEWALTPRNSIDLPHPIQHLQFNRLRNAFTSMRDGNDDYLGSVSGSTGLVSREADPVPYQKIRFTPYLEARFGSEWPDDLRLTDGELSSERLFFPMSMTNFEADFFAAKLFYQSGDSLYFYDLATQTGLDQFYFPDSMTSSVHWVGGE